jgi:hypothetical protein
MACSVPRSGGEPTCVRSRRRAEEAGGGEEGNNTQAGARAAAPLAGLMGEIFAYLNAMRQAFFNAGQRLSG